MSINDFIKRLTYDMKINNREFNSEDIYFMLKYMGIKKDNSLVDDIEKFYQNFLNSLNNSLVKYEIRTQKYGENATHYIAFYADKKADYLEAVKVYFPVKYEYMISALKTIFLYLIRNNIMATVKFHVKATNEGIVIRFYNKNDVVPFINYCNSNFILKDLLESLNPFIASKFGIGMVIDDNTVNSYMGTLCKLLQEYFVLIKNTDAYNSASDVDFLNYIINRVEEEENEEMRFNINSILNSLKAIMKK